MKTGQRTGPQAESNLLEISRQNRHPNVLIHIAGHQLVSVCPDVEI